jgi:hypothetical protein
VKATTNTPSPQAVTEAAIRRSDERDRAIVDSFWQYKDQVYRYLINSRAGILADLACQWFMRSNLDRISPDDYFGTEISIFSKLPGLRDLLVDRLFETKLMRRLTEPVAYRARSFFIDPSSSFFSRHDNARYRQIKEKRELSRRDIGVLTSEELNRDFFDDQCDLSSKAAL